MLLQCDIKDPGHSAKSAGGMLHLNMRTTSTLRSQSGLTMLLSRHSVGTYQGDKPTCNSSENTQPLLSLLWTDPGRKSGISVWGLISTLNKTKQNKSKKAQAGNERLNLLPKSLQARKKPPPPLPVYLDFVRRQNEGISFFCVCAAVCVLKVGWGV